MLPKAIRNWAGAGAGEYGKAGGDQSKYSPDRARLRKPLTTAINWRAQYSVSPNKAWARLARVHLSIFSDRPHPMI
jgi:hypothetical protein